MITPPTHTQVLLPPLPSTLFLSTLEDNQLHWFLVILFAKISIFILVPWMVKNLPTVQETQVGSLCWKDRLEKGMAICLLQYSCLKNPMDRGAWWAVVHGVTKSWT